MGVIKGLLIFLANVAVFVLAIRFVTLIFERVGVFRTMERFFGKRSENTEEKIYVDPEPNNDDEPTEFSE
jgi:hypothetical protein